MLWHCIVRYCRTRTLRCVLRQRMLTLARLFPATSISAFGKKTKHHDDRYNMNENTELRYYKIGFTFENSTSCSNVGSPLYIRQSILCRFCTIPWIDFSSSVSQLRLPLRSRPLLRACVMIGWVRWLTFSSQTQYYNWLVVWLTNTLANEAILCCHLLPGSNVHVTHVHTAVQLKGITALSTVTKIVQI